MTIIKNIFDIKSHLTTILCLFALLFFIILTVYYEMQNLKTIDQSMSSIYADRLVPATDIFYITDQLYDRRLRLQSFLLSAEGKNTAPQLSLNDHNRIIDSLLFKFKGTYLVESESVCLKGLTGKWKKYKSHEAEIVELAMDNQKEAAQALFNDTGSQLFKSIITDLHLLTTIQTQVGGDLMDESKSNISSTNSMFTLQFGIIFLIITLIGKGFLFATKVIKFPKQKFHLN